MIKADLTVSGIKRLHGSKDLGGLEYSEHCKVRRIWKSKFWQHVFPTDSLKRENPETSDAKFAEDGNQGSALQETVSR